MIFLLLMATAILDLAVFIKLSNTFRLLQMPKGEMLPENELPTVSICISARNETHAMTQCLEHVVASDYPKLEVIVLDDGSRDDTSILIKSFAHSGVRFVEGKTLPEGWLGKNHAQLLLAREASGKLVFFMDVDTLIDRHTVSRAVAAMAARQDKMISIIPLRSEKWQLGTLMTTMRHFWIFMRHKPEHPRATANAWLIERELLLQEFNTDDKLPQSMKVETTIAGKLANNGYHLIMGDAWMGLSYEKRWSSQVETSIRVLYPQCHKHWYEVAMLVLILCVALIPYVAVLITPWALLLVALQFTVALYYMTRVWVRYGLIGALLLPVTLVQEIILLFVSSYRYNFGTITWKGRPITATRDIS